MREFEVSSPAVMAPVFVMVMFAKTDIHADHGRSPRRRSHIDRTGCDANRLRIDDHGCGRHADRWWRHDVNGRGRGIDRSRSRVHRGVNRRRLEHMTERMDGSYPGENLADCGPFTVASGGGLNTGGSESGETQDCYFVFHTVLFH